MESSFQKAVSDLERQCCVAIEIRNESSFTLSKPETYCAKGCVVHPPPPLIGPRTQDFCIFAKTAFSPCGSGGLLKYEIDGELIFLKFESPLISILFSHEFGLYVTENRIDSDVANEKLHTNFSIKSDKVKRCWSNSELLEFEGTRFKIIATMAPTAKSIVKLLIKDK